MDDTTLRLRISGEKNQFLRVEALARSHPQCDDYWDGNWIKTRIALSAGGFQGEVEADLRSEEFVRFRDSLRLLYSLRPDFPPLVVEFSTMEMQLGIQIRGIKDRNDGVGHCFAKCTVADDLGQGRSRLEFTLLFDQTFLPAILRDLDAIIVAFPVKGRPPE